MRVQINLFTEVAYAMVFKKAVLVLLALGVLVSPVFAEESDVSGEAGIAVMSNYIWRGIRLSDGIVLQPTAGGSYKGFGMNLWSNIDFDTRKNAINETDFTLNYARNVGPVSLDAGYIYYGIAGFDTQELYLGASYDTLLSPSATLYWDVDSGQGGFLSLGIGHSFPIRDVTAIDLGLTLNVNLDNAVMGTKADGNTFTGLYNGDFLASADFEYKGITFTPMLGVTFALSDDAETAIKGLDLSDDGLAGNGESTLVYGGLNASVSF